jgi:hypothetical protein
MAARDHEHIEELLAGYVLQALEGADADEADRLLTEHVPACTACRDTLSDFQAVTGDLALTASPASPPDVLLPRLRAEVTRAPGARSPRRFSVPVVAAAASFAALLAVAGFAVALNSRVSQVEGQRELVSQALSDASAAGATPVGLQGEEGNRPDNAMVEVSGPQVERFTLVGNAVPSPRPGDIYRLWLGSGGDNWQFKAQFVPDGGYVGLSFPIDTSQYDTVLITEESASSTPATPSPDWAWSSTLASQQP